MFDNIKKAIGDLSIVIAALLLAIIFFGIFNYSSNRVIWQNCQPATVNYNSNYTYCFSVIEGGFKLTLYPYQLSRIYYLFIGQKETTPNYGHSKTYSFTHEGDKMDDYIKKSQVIWDNTGLTFVESSGHRLFFPKELFLGVR